jgi:hypothetical protein
MRFVCELFQEEVMSPIRFRTCGDCEEDFAILYVSIH